jgi:hypothetical protein
VCPYVCHDPPPPPLPTFDVWTLSMRRERSRLEQVRCGTLYRLLRVGVS